MPRNFKPCDRDQMLLLPPSLRDWLPPGDLAWFVADATAQIDLRPFLKSYREDDRGGSGYHPEMLVALLLYAYCRGVTSSREIERRCSLDVGFRAVMAQQTPDHATIARFRRQSVTPLSGLRTSILRMGAQAGLVRLGTVSIDGTKLEANHTADRLGV